MNSGYTNEMLDAVGWANRRIASFGFDTAAAITVTDGTARLLSATGRVLDQEPCGDTPLAAVGVLMLRFERAMRLFSEFSEKVKP